MSNILPFTGQVDRDAVAINFFTKILPPSGYYYSAIKQGKRFHDTAYVTVEDLWESCKNGDRNKLDVYFTTASFRDNRGRTKDNILLIQSFSIDVDFGEAGHADAGYATPELLNAQLRRFLEVTGLPIPMIVKSGGGLHCHWPLTEPLTLERWQPYADGLAELCRHEGLKCDHGLTVNAAHIMRVPGTSNRKLSAPRPVELAAINAERSDVDRFAVCLRAAGPKRTSIAVPPKPAYLTDLEGGAFPDLYEPVELAVLVDNCGVAASFQESGDISEPAWMRLANLYHYVEDGERLYREHSQNGYANYSESETKKKWERAGALTGPPKCAGFRDECGEKVRAICLACPRLDAIATPIQGLEALADNSPIICQDGVIGEIANKTAPYKKWDTTEKGHVKANLQNAGIAIDRLKWDCRHDTFHSIKLVNGEVLEDAMVRKLREQSIIHFEFDPGKEHASEALAAACERNGFDPVLDYLAGLKWDGEPRLDYWLSVYLGAHDTALHRCFGRKTLIAAVRRVRQPGCKFDYLLVLEGPQRAGKSTAWRILAGDENFSDVRIMWDDPRQQRESSQGVWIHEIAELVGIRKADVELIKSFLSRQNDAGRSAYARFATPQKRHCIHVGTHNPSGAGWMTDPTGGSRFWPVKIGKIELEWLRRDRDQLWAEAAHYEARGELIELPKELYVAAKDAQDGRRIHDPWFDVLAMIEGDRISSYDIMTRELGIMRDRLNSHEGGRISVIMRQLGWDGPKTLRIGDKLTRGYSRNV